MAAVGGGTRRGVNLTVDEDGVHMHFSLSIPRPAVFRRRCVRRMFRMRNGFINGFYPLGPLVVLPTVLALVVATLYADGDHWLRSGRIATFAWSVGQAMPWADACARYCKISVLAVWVGLTVLLLFVFFQRRLLRWLLGANPFLDGSRGMSLKRRVWAAAVMLLSGRKPLLYAFQSSLPTLPLPTVEDTVARYMRSVEPLQEPAQFAASQKAAREFLASQGPLLQRYLQLKWWTSRGAYVT